MATKTSISSEEAESRREQFCELLSEGERSGFAEYNYDQFMDEMDRGRNRSNATEATRAERSIYEQTQKDS